jgi:hypothetical protein
MGFTERLRESQEAVPKIVRQCARGGVPNRRTAQADGPSCSDGRESLGGALGPLDPRSDEHLYGRSQQPDLSSEAQGSWLPEGGIHHLHALLHRRATHSTELLTH